MAREMNIDTFADHVTHELTRDGFDTLTETEFRHAYHHGWTIYQTCADAINMQTQARLGRKWQVEREGGELVQVATSGRWYWRIPADGTRVLDYFDTEDDAAKDFIKTRLQNV